jgi:hypothetical protein
MLSSPMARRSCGRGVLDFCAVAVPRKVTARTERMIKSFIQADGRSMVDSFDGMGEMYSGRRREGYAKNEWRESENWEDARLQTNRYMIGVWG